jgi:hypothetical protein
LTTQGDHDELQVYGKGALRCVELDDYWGSSKDRVNRGVVEPAWYEIHDENSTECGDHMWHYDATPVVALWIGTITERN